MPFQTASELVASDEASAHPAEAVEVPDCLLCGACCFSTLKTYVRVTGDDHARLGDLAERVTHFIENRCYLLLVDGHCAALTLEPQTGQFRCAAYEHRPTICRDLERGSPECRFEHAKKADRSSAAMQRLRSGRGEGT